MTREVDGGSQVVELKLPAKACRATAALNVSLAGGYDAFVAPATTTGKNVMPREGGAPLIPSACGSRSEML